MTNKHKRNILEKDMGGLLTKRRNEKGFTLIEIVLVLAIAGLIFVIVFLAVSGAQRARRDTARKADLSRLRAAMEQYSGNNNGTYPPAGSNVTATGGILNAYLPSSSFVDPSGAAYVVNITVGSAANVTAPSGGMNIRINGICSGTTTTAGTGNRQYAILYALEQGGQNCVDNQ